MADHKFTVDLSGLELSQAEQARISGALQHAAMSEVAALSGARSLNLQTKLFPGTHGGRRSAGRRKGRSGRCQ